jgi:hypothetical protein
MPNLFFMGSSFGTDCDIDYDAGMILLSMSSVIKSMSFPLAGTCKSHSFDIWCSINLSSKKPSAASIKPDAWAFRAIIPLL